MQAERDGVANPPLMSEAECDALAEKLLPRYAVYAPWAERLLEWRYGEKGHTWAGISAVGRLNWCRSTQERFGDLIDAASARLATPDDGAAGLVGKVKRLRTEFGFPPHLNFDECLSGLRNTIDAVNKRATAAEARAEAAERERDEARATAIAECLAALKATHQPFAVHGVTDGRFEDTVQARTLAALAAGSADGGEHGT